MYIGKYWIIQTEDGYLTKKGRIVLFEYPWQYKWFLGGVSRETGELLKPQWYAERKVIQMSNNRLNTVVYMMFYEYMGEKGNNGEAVRVALHDYIDNWMTYEEQYSRREALRK
jgi:hypothetical protein